MDVTLTMLIVDDEQVNRSILRNIFEKEYHILEAKDGVEALEVLERNHTIDVILLDLFMPRMNGFDLLKIIKEKIEYKHIAVIVNTQYGELDNELKALEYGADDFICKPYDSRVVKQRVTNIVKRSIYYRREVEDTVRLLKDDTYKDSLTGLLNRGEFYKQAQRFIQFEEEECVIAIWNIDRFKIVNELYGSTNGDAVLIALAKELFSVVGRLGIACRMEADKFLFCTTKRFFEENLPKMEEILAGKGDWNPLDYVVQLHMGVYLVEDTNMPVGSMCDRADMALQMIKQSYITRYNFYSEDLKLAILGEQELVSDMEIALKEKQFLVLLQPIVDTFSARTISAEALIRWKHPVKGMISPGFFIPLFEKNGFISKLDLFVCEEVCRFQKHRIEEGKDTVPISVNISRVNFYKPEFFKEILKITGKYGIDNSLIKIEITEGAYEEKPKEMIEAIKEFKKNSFKVLMDDFGSGYSSLNTLKDFNVDILKIDMKFVNDIETSERASNILFSIFQMAQALNMGTIAEGVETQAQFELLAGMGCDSIQGYLFSKPITQQEFEERLEREEVREEATYAVDNRRTVLVVDDQPIERQIIKKLIGDKYVVREACNGKEALDILKRNFEAISLVVADIRMPEMGGLELISCMNEAIYLREIPVIIVTAYGERENEEEALNRGALEIITKPYDGKLVRKRIENILKISETEAKIRQLQNIWEHEGN